MPFIPQSQGQRRAERVRLEEAIPAVVRFPDGNRTSGRLKVVSLTGGLLCVPKPVRQGTVGKVMFLTPSGAVLGSAEMLSPLSWELQAFRFVSLPTEDHDRLEVTIKLYLKKTKDDHQDAKRGQGQIEKLRPW